jgi:hypothetical protein
MNLVCPDSPNAVEFIDQRSGQLNVARLLLAEMDYKEKKRKYDEEVRQQPKKKAFDGRKFERVQGCWFPLYYD